MPGPILGQLPAPSAGAAAIALRESACCPDRAVRAEVKTCLQTLICPQGRLAFFPAPEGRDDNSPTFQRWEPMADERKSRRDD
jgi:hypothetical protein